MSRSKDASNGPESKQADNLRKKATSGKGRVNQPKGAMNKQHRTATKVARKEKNPGNKRDAVADMEF